MKKFLRYIIVLLTAAPGQLMAAPTQDGGTTFTVDADLPAPKEALYRLPAETLLQRLTMNAQIPDDGTQVVDYSFRGESLVARDANVMFDLLRTAYADHRPVVLSPDAVWLTICQGFSRYVNAHAEQMRPLLVSHVGKLDLSVTSAQDLLNGQADWSALMQQFTNQISQHSKGGLAQTVTADFTTTTPTERIASQVTLMDAFKQYFNYEVIYIVCGIPSITLTGTPQDWRTVLSKTEQLKALFPPPSAGPTETSWLSSLLPILREFVAASEGRVNRAFWQNIVRRKRVDELRGGGCMGAATRLDGWFLKFFPNEYGELPDSVSYDYRGMPSQMVRVGFKYRKVTPGGQTVSETPMELWAGFVGMDEDRRTGALTPRIGWLVRTANEDEELVSKFYHLSSSEIRLRDIAEVPLALTQIEHIRSLVLEFRDGKVNLPDWFTKMQIDELTIWGKLAAEEAEQLRTQMPKTLIMIIEP